MRDEIKLTTADIRHLFELLNGELRDGDTHAELYVVGGAAMCLALGARSATRDVDAWFKPSTLVRQAAARVAARANVPENWLNDAVKVWLSDHGSFGPYLELSHLQVFVASPAYLLALKCMSMRLGAEFHDLDDVRYLLRHLDIRTADAAMQVVTQYFDVTQVPLKTRFALEELLA